MTVHPLARPLSVDGGDVGVLLSHGFTGSPVSMLPWANHLVERGYSVRVPRLPGHGTTWQELNRTRWPDWYAEVERAFTELRERCERVVVAGLSMGGCLVLRIAEQYPDDVAAVVLVNPAVNLERKDLLALPILRHLVPAVQGIGNDIRKENVEESGYDRTPLHALHSQMRMWREVRADLARVTQPLLLFRSVEDHVVDASGAPLIMSGVSSTSKREVLLHNSYHVATLDHDMDFIFAESADFIAEHTGATDVR
ncbi:MAG: alpha/beta hydrolase [Nocardioidaceae bacterium]